MHYSAVKELTPQQIQQTENPWRIQQFRERIDRLVERLDTIETDIAVARQNAINLRSLFSAIMEREEC